MGCRIRPERLAKIVPRSRRAIACRAVALRRLAELVVDQTLRVCVLVQEMKRTGEINTGDIVLPVFRECFSR